MLLEPLGSDTLALIRFGPERSGSTRVFADRGEAGEMTGRFPPDAGLRVGVDIDVALALEHFHLFDRQDGAAIRGANW